MKLNKRLKRFLKIIGFLFLIIISVLLTLYFILINNAEKALSEFVRIQSNGKAVLTTSKTNINLFSGTIEIKNLYLSQTDSLADVNYQFSCNRISFKLKSVLKLFKKEISVDSILLANPSIQIEVKKLIAAEKQVSLAEQMNNIYEVVKNFVSFFALRKFEIENGSFALYDKTIITNNSKPLQLNGFSFKIEGFSKENTKPSANRFLFTDNVELRLPAQHVQLPSSNNVLSFKSFLLKTSEQLIRLDSCRIHILPTEKNASRLSIFTPQLQLRGIHFNDLYKNSLIHADSILCDAPELSGLLIVKEQQRSSQKQIELKKELQHFFTKLKVGYLGLLNASIHLQTQKNAVTNSFNTRQLSFELDSLDIDPNRSKPLLFSGLNLNLSKNNFYTKDSAFSVKFEAIHFKKSTIVLKNLYINSSKNNKEFHQHHLPELYIEGIRWDDLMFDNKISAEHISLLNPDVKLSIPEKKNVDKNKKNDGLKRLKTLVNVNKLKIENANLNIKQGNAWQSKVKNLHLELWVNDEIRNSQDNAAEALKQFNFNEADVTVGQNKIRITNLQMDNHAENTSIQTADVITPNAKAAIKNLNLGKLGIQLQKNKIHIKGVQWSFANIELLAQNKDSLVKNNESLSFNLENIDAQNTFVSYSNQSQKISAAISAMKADQLGLLENGKPFLKNLILTGSKLKLKDSSLQLSISNFLISDFTESKLSNINFTKKSSKDSIHLFISEVEAKADFDKILNNNLSIDKLMIKNISSFVRIEPDTISNKVTTAPIKLPKLNINNLSLIDFNTKLTLKSSKGSTDLSLKSFSFKGNGIKVDSMGKLVMNNAQANFNTILMNENDTVAIQVNNFQLNNAANFYFNPSAKENNWGFQLPDLAVDNIHLSKKINDTASSEISINNFQLKHAQLSDNYFKNIRQFILNNQQLQLGIKEVAVVNPQIKLFTGNIQYNAASERLLVDSFFFTPNQTIEAFQKTLTYENDYISANTGKIEIEKLNLKKYFEDSILYIKSIKIQRPKLFPYRDKTLPDNVNDIKPLPVDQIKKIPVKVSIDAVFINNGYVGYTEVGEKTKQPGFIKITDLNAKIFNVKNTALTSTDSLILTARANFMDSIALRLNFKQSYLDTLSAFHIAAKASGASLTALNPFLVPVASVKIEKGFLDSLSFSAIGREYLSIGEMKMHYHDLKVILVANGKETKRNFLTGLGSFIINSFVIKKENKKRVGKIFFERIRYEAIFNYWAKMALSGIATSAGAFTNKKYERQYKRELKKRNLPPIEFNE